MTEALTREQFAAAVSNAVAGVLNVYREVDAMFRDLSSVLAEGEPRFTPLIKRMVPGAGRQNPDARYLRNYQASLFVPADATEPDDDDDEEDDEDAPEEDGEDEDEPKRSKRALTIKVGASIIVARAAIYDRARAAFEPTLTMGVLSRCRPEGTAPVGAVLRTKPGRLKRLFRAIDAQRVPGKPLQTTVTAQVLGQSKAKNSRLLFDEVTPLRSYPLFDVTSDKLHEMVATLRKDWAASQTSP